MLRSNYLNCSQIEQIVFSNFSVEKYFADQNLQSLTSAGSNSGLGSRHSFEIQTLIFKRDMPIFELANIDLKPSVVLKAIAPESEVDAFELQTESIRIELISSLDKWQSSHVIRAKSMGGHRRSLTIPTGRPSSGF